MSQMRRNIPWDHPTPLKGTHEDENADITKHPEFRREMAAWKAAGGKTGHCPCPVCHGDGLARIPGTDAVYDDLCDYCGGEGTDPDEGTQ